jgi:hypothetical protein
MFLTAGRLRQSKKSAKALAHSKTLPRELNCFVTTARNSGPESRVAALMHLYPRIV